MLEQTLIPAPLGKEIEHKATVIDLDTMELCLFIRDVVLPASEPSHGEMPKFWKEVSEWARGWKPDTIRRKVQSLRSWPADVLMKWHESGLSFDHLCSAVYCSENTKKQGYNTPEKVLNWCIEQGVEVPDSNPPASRPRTVLQMEGHFLGESNQTAMEIINKWFGRFCQIAQMLKWPEEKARRFDNEIIRIRKEYFNESNSMVD